MALNIRSIYKSAGASLIAKQLVAQGMSPMQAQQTAQAVVGGKIPPPSGIRMPPPEVSVFGLSPMMLLVIGIIAVGGIGFYLMQKK